MRGICKILMLLTLLTFSITAPSYGEDQWLTIKGQAGPGQGKHIVLLTGDEEYRSEESMPALAKILAKHHGFNCTVLFSINKKSGEIDPETLDNIPGLEALEGADMMIIFNRFRNLPDDQVKKIIDFSHTGKPVMGFRTATHAFNLKNPHSPYAKFNWNSTEPKGGWGREVLGETWVNHYGHHKVESTRGLILNSMRSNPITKGVHDIWGPSDVYGITTLNGDCQPLVMGQVLTGMNPTDPPRLDRDIVPVVWLKNYATPEGKTSRVFASTMGHGGDFLCEDYRRLVVNGVYWCLNLEAQIPDKNNVELVGEYKPNDIGNGGHKKGVFPKDLALKE